MKKCVSNKNYVFNESNDEKKELYLHDLKSSVHSYIRTGTPQKQLKDIMECEDEFREKYQKYSDISKVLEVLMEEHEIDVLKDLSLNIRGFGIDSTISQNLIEIISEKIATFFKTTLVDELKKIMKDYAYLNHMNMLYMIIDDYRQKCSFEEEYEKVRHTFKEIVEITKILSEEKRITSNELSKRLNVSDEELEEKIYNYNNYFNIRFIDEEHYQISLSSDGKKINKYFYNHLDAPRYSYEQIEQISYNNCLNIMESIDNSLRKGIDYELKIEGVLPDKERVIKQKYHKMVAKHRVKNLTIFYDEIDMNTQVYYKKGVDDCEKLRFKIPQGWGE